MKTKNPAYASKNHHFSRFLIKKSYYLDVTLSSTRANPPIGISLLIFKYRKIVRPVELHEKKLSRKEGIALENMKLFICS